MVVRVLLVDDHDLLRAGLAAVLGATDDIEVVGEAHDAASAFEAAGSTRPDVVLMDVQMPGGDGIGATAAILERRPDTRVLVLTTFDLDEYVLRALRAGAAGFLLKTAPPEELVDAVRACAAGRTTLGPSIMRRLVSSYVEHAVVDTADVPGLTDLTPRERDVLRALARGLSNSEIGAELYLAETTVKTHVTRILAKLGLRDRVQAVALAHERGLVPRHP